MLDDTLVMMLGEFGRSPVINNEAGRDHWTAVMSLVMSGGGFQQGRVIGSTDSKGLQLPVNPSDRKTSLPQPSAT